MPWKETCAMDERIRFIAAANEGDRSLSAICADHGISRTLGYKWLGRYRSEGVEGLKDRSRAPLHHGLARPLELVAAIMALKERYPYWGPRKLRRKVGEVMPGIALPARSTIGDWLRKEGLTQPRRRRPRCTGYGGPFAEACESNDVWAVDFKGWFRTGDGHRCDPLTMSDLWSRYILGCEGVAEPDYEHVRPQFEAAFCEFGLPRRIRSDNGPPFATTAAGGLSELSVWLIKLGIACERIEPGKPGQNGRHERMHRTLKEETADPPAATLIEQQERFDEFCRVFNEERPHEALGLETPASLYRQSPRSYPCPLREPVYAEGVAVRKVRSSGQIKWGGELIFVSQVLAGEWVGVDETETGDWVVRFADVTLGFIDRKRRRLYRKPMPGSRACGFMDNATALPSTPQAQQQQHQSLK